MSVEQNIFMIILFLFPLAFSLLIIVVRMQEDKRMSDEQIEEEKKRKRVSIMLIHLGLYHLRYYVYLL